MDESYAAQAALARAGVETNLLRLTGALPPEFEGATIGKAATPIHDLNGEVLYQRLPIAQYRGESGWVDVAVHPAMGASLLSASRGLAWDEATVVAEAHRAAERHNVDYDELRIVAYSYPKLAVQFLREGAEALMLEWMTWAVVPESPKDRGYDEPPGNFERWSMLGSMSEERRAENARRFEERVATLDETARQMAQTVDLTVISSTAWEPSVTISLVDSRDLHYSRRTGDHVPCYELRGQQTDVWCVAASVQMVLDFYRYEYSQVRLAEELGLGTLANPNGLPYERDSDVVTVLENMTTKALDAEMNTAPTFSEFRSEIRANRPLVSFIPGHSRTVAGYTRSQLALVAELGFRGLLVYDPWPPNAGVITTWENFDATSYRVTFTARVNTA